MLLYFVIYSFVKHILPYFCIYSCRPMCNKNIFLVVGMLFVCVFWWCCEWGKERRRGRGYGGGRYRKASPRVPRVARTATGSKVKTCC